MIILNCFGMFSMFFWHRYLFRVVKIIAMVIVCQYVLNMKMTGRSPRRTQQIYLTAVIFTTITGLINTYLMQPSQMGQKQYLWIWFQWTKAITALLILTPILNIFPLSKDTRITVQFYWVVIMLILSPFARYYRQWYAAKERTRIHEQLEHKSL